MVVKLPDVQTCDLVVACEVVYAVANTMQWGNEQAVMRWKHKLGKVCSSCSRGRGYSR